MNYVCGSLAQDGRCEPLAHTEKRQRLDIFYNLFTLSLSFVDLYLHSKLIILLIELFNLIEFNISSVYLTP